MAFPATALQSGSLYFKEYVNMQLKIKFRNKNKQCLVWDVILTVERG